MASSASAAAAPASAVSTAAIVTATSSSPSSSSSSPSASSSGAAGTWDETIKTGKFLIAGGVAGAVSRTCVSPLERLKILFQIKLTPTAAQEQAPTVWRSLVHIFKTEGLMGYFKGNGTNVIRMIPYSAVQFAAYEQYKKLLLTYPSPVDDLNTPRRLFAGAMAGITSVCATYPLDLIRTRLSAQGEGPDRKYKGIYDCLRTILREEGGARGLFRGLSPTLMGVAPYVALNFTVYESIKRWLLDQMQVKELSVPVRLLCGALAGATAQSITYPFDVIRRRMQMKGCSGPSFAYTSTLNAFTTIIRVEGVRGLYKGMVPNCLKVAPSMSISFVMYEFCKKLLFGGEVQGGRGAL
ncbi:EF-hand domain-containing protein [Capsaspora owczarzaki ATCC 30864]|uniref:EF-hand domain-containing protein n=1 Tax=Capsaspora owczarzaki (strain ATCC 30864) TaxID=595528 RepID=A0A0D2X1D4_CAPO3|nr:EF-hand domain-containing protein [Capsaspora owczarzaki ATCC 30864]KJE90614.1 EF-hand domain-containing protein [Capsaspora owczarzaki ATCC 30864]|eukprot:XP_004364767.1 EF-hand domain-containing protein [Capsaspora owczarzaki ATCC 30864]